MTLLAKKNVAILHQQVWNLNEEGANKTQEIWQKQMQ